MSKLIYKLTKLGKKAKDVNNFLNLIDNNYGGNGHLFSKDIKDFFSNNKTTELVNKNDWDGVFEWWRKFMLPKFGGRSYWNYDLLSDFLYLLDIRFWEYLKYDAFTYADEYMIDGIREIEDE